MYTQVAHGETRTVFGQLTTVRRDGDVAEAIKIKTSDDTTGWIVLAPDVPARTREWTEGEWYRFDGVVGASPALVLRPREERVMDAFADLSGSYLIGDEDFSTTCPVCGGTLVDADGVGTSEAVQSLVADLAPAVFGIGTSDLDVEAFESGVDDWRPIPDEDSALGVEEPHTVRCTDCGRDVTAYYREQIAEEREARQNDQQPMNSGGMQDIVNETLESPEAAPSTNAQAMQSRESMDVGMATGGAKDATSFRDNVHEGYVPQPDALTYEGLFYDYHFDTGDDGDANDSSGLFYPSYATACTDHPVSGERAQYLTVGLNSTLTEADLERKPLNLVAVVDVSGSMLSPFDQYYYDEHGRQREVEPESTMAATKMAAACDALSALTEQLRPEDRFGVVLYDTDAHVAKPLRSVGETNMDAIRSHIRDLTARGGTDMAAGFDAAMDLLEPHTGASLTEVENRVVFLTDAMPNLGNTDRDDITDAFADAAEEHVHTTFVGVGLDANADLVESISSVRGANHYFVHSSAEFRERLAEEFTYMVTPLVFDLSLTVETDGVEIDTVYGSPNADRSTGEVLHVATLFPSPTTNGETRGGVTLLRLNKPDPVGAVELTARWTERDGTTNRESVSVSLPTDAPQFDNSGIRKAVVLARYGEVLREWASNVRANAGNMPDETSGEGVDDWQYDPDDPFSEWEEQSIPLRVPEAYIERFDALYEYVESEAAQLGDDTLQQELDVLDVLRNPDAHDSAPDSDTARSTPDTCPSCGTDIPTYGSEAHFCPHCGVTIDEQRQ